MTKPRTIRVLASPGRRVPIHASVATGVAGELLIVDEHTAVELPCCSYVTRRLRAGDLLKAPPALAADTPDEPAAEPAAEATLEPDVPMAPMPDPTPVVSPPINPDASIAPIVTGKET